MMAIFPFPPLHVSKQRSHLQSACCASCLFLSPVFFLFHLLICILCLPICICLSIHAFLSGYLGQSLLPVVLFVCRLLRHRLVLPVSLLGTPRLFLISATTSLLWFRIVTSRLFFRLLIIAYSYLSFICLLFIHILICAYLRRMFPVFASRPFCFIPQRHLDSRTDPPFCFQVHLHCTCIRTPYRTSLFTDECGPRFLVC